MTFIAMCKFVLGQQRSRMLATLFKDERCQQLPAYGILEKMYASTDAFSNIKLSTIKSKLYVKFYTYCKLGDNELKFLELTLQF